LTGNNTQNHVRFTFVLIYFIMLTFGNFGADAYTLF